MVYAVVVSGGKQYKVEVGQTIDVDLLSAEPGETIELSRVLMVSGDDGIEVGQPLVSGASVVAEVIGGVRGRKIIVFKYKSKKGYAKKQGHRQSYTQVRIDDVKMRKTVPRKKAAEVEEAAVVPTEEVTENV